jgi:hypothetical protein
LNGTNAGPKITPKTELSGAPTFTEVAEGYQGFESGHCVRLSLRPQLFKLGGDVLAKRLVSDFGALWPTEEEMVSAHQIYSITNTAGC